MTDLCRWVVDVARKNWESFSGRPPAPTFMDIPQDVFLNVCEWLSVRDILALRMTNKCIAQSTTHSIIWFSLLRKLMVPLPILPPTSKYRFGMIEPSNYEWLMRRSLYLEQNWRRSNPVACHSRFQAFGRTILMKMLPGGKYMVSVTKNVDSDLYSLVLWDLDQAGVRVALTGSTSNSPYLKLEVTASMVNEYMCIIIAYAKPPRQTGDGTFTQVRVIAIPIAVLEEYSQRLKDPDMLREFDGNLKLPFRVLHESRTSCDVGQLALGHIDNKLVLVTVHRPRALSFHYLASGQRGNLLLGPVRPYDTLRHSIWAVKLLPGQNSILISRVLVEIGVFMDSTLFTLDMFVVPGPGTSLKYPAPIGRQLISGLHFDGFYFSDLETSWFSSLHDPEGLLPAPANDKPPPLSIFITTKSPRGFVHCIMPPQAVPYETLQLPFGRGKINRYIYELPACKVERHKWDDDFARPIVIPGAYRSIVYMRPHIRPEFQMEGLKASGLEVLRFCTYITRCEDYDKFATPRTTGNYILEKEQDSGGEMEIEEGEPSLTVALEEGVGLRKRSIRVPDIPNIIAWKMMHGTTAIAFDESVGKLCVATTEDTDIHVLDFGGENWEVATVP